MLQLTDGAGRKEVWNNNYVWDCKGWSLGAWGSRDTIYKEQSQRGRKDWAGKGREVFPLSKLNLSCSKTSRQWCPWASGRLGKWLYLIMYRPALLSCICSHILWPTSCKNGWIAHVPAKVSSSSWALEPICFHLLKNIAPVIVPSDPSSQNSSSLLDHFQQHTNLSLVWKTKQTFLWLHASLQILPHFFDHPPTPREPNALKELSKLAVFASSPPIFSSTLVSLVFVPNPSTETAFPKKSTITLFEPLSCYQVQLPTLIQVLISTPSSWKHSLLLSFRHHTLLALLPPQWLLPFYFTCCFSLIFDL